MDAADLIGMFYDLFGFFNRNSSASALAYEHIGNMTHKQAAVLVQVSGALAHHFAHSPALAGGYAEMTLVLLDIITALFIVYLLGFSGYGAFHRYYSHYAGTHGSIHRVMLLALGCMPVERLRDLGMYFQELFVEHHKLVDSRSIKRNQIEFHIDQGYDRLDKQADIRALV